MHEKENIYPKPQRKPITLVVIQCEKHGRKYLENFSRCELVNIKGVYLNKEDHEATAFAENIKIPILSSIKHINKIEDVDLMIIYDEKADKELIRIAYEKGISLIKGNTWRFLKRLLYENEIAKRKQSELIREFDDKIRKFSIQSELSHIITTTIEMDILLKNIISLCMRITDTIAGAIIMYDETIKRFTISGAYGLTEKFINRIRLPLSDPIIEDLLTIRKEIALSHIEKVHSSTLFYAASKDGMKSLLALPLLTKEKLIGILCVFSNEIHEFTAKEKDTLSIISGQIALAIENAQLYKSSREKQILVEQLLSKLIFAQEEERKRIAAEIHDSIAQAIVGILTKVQTSQALLALNRGNISDELEELRKIATESCNEVRQIIFNLRPTSLDDLGLVPSIENLIKRIEKESNITIQLIVNEREKRLHPIFETLAFRIIQEALTNVRKHSEAKKAWVELYIEPSRISIKVVDNGKGFSWDNVTHKFTEGDSFGLQSMKERASLVGGKVDIISEEGSGTTVSVEIPIRRNFTTTFA